MVGVSPSPARAEIWGGGNRGARMTVAAAPPGAWPGLVHEGCVLETNEPSPERAGKRRALSS